MSIKSLPTFNIILSAGGSRGAFQAGVMDELDRLGIFDLININAIYGTSAGALNGAFWAHGKQSLLKDLWLKYTGRFFYFTGSQLTRYFLHRYIHSEDLEHTFIFNFVSLDTGHSYYMSPTMFETDEDYRKALRASSSPPIWPYFSPVNGIKTNRYGTIDAAMDGGIKSRFIQPRSSHPSIFIDTMNQFYSPYKGKNPLRVGLSSLNLMSISLANEQVDDLSTDIIRIYPEIDLSGNNFSRAALKAGYEHGVKRAEDFIEELELWL